MYYIFTALFVACMHPGTVDYLQPVSSSIWVRAMATEAESPQPIYHEHFFRSCRDLVATHFGIDIHRDVDVENCINVFRFLSSSMHV